MKGALACAAVSLVARPDWLLRPASATWPENGFNAETPETALQALFGNEEIAAHEAIRISAADLAENGAVVPVKIDVAMDHVESIAVLSDANPFSLIASFEFGPTTEPFVATRVRLADSSNLIVVVKANGKLYTSSKFINVTEGGCGA